MALTIQQKIEAYEHVLSKLNNSECLYICVALNNYCFDKFASFYAPYRDTLSAFPELLEYQPFDDHFYGGWWPYYDTKSRIDVVEKYSNN